MVQRVSFGFLRASMVASVSEWVASRVEGLRVFGVSIKL